MLVDKEKLFLWLDEQKSSHEAQLKHNDNVCGVSYIKGTIDLINYMVYLLERGYFNNAK